MPTEIARLTLAIDTKGAETRVRVLNQELDKTGKSATRAQAGAKSVGDSTATMGEKARNAAKEIRGIVAGFLGFVAVRNTIRTIVDFEKSMSTLQAVTNATTNQMKEFNAVARDLGATTVFSAKEAADGLVFLARAGFSVQAALDAIPGVLQLAQAGALGLASAADIASNVLSQFNLVASETGRVGDILVKTANSANTDVTQLAEALKFVGPVAGALRISLEETSAAVGALGDSGIQAGQAGTNLRGILAGLLGPTDAATTSLARMGLTLEDVDPVANGFIEIFTKLRDRGFSAADAVNIFGRRNAAAALVLRDSVGKVVELNESLEAADGTAQKAARTMSDNLDGAIKGLLSSLSEAALQAGDAGLSGGLRGLIDTSTNTIRILVGMRDELTDADTAAQILAGTIRFLTVLLAAFAAVKVVTFLVSMITSVSGLTVAVRGLTTAVAANPIGLLAVGLTAVVGLFFALSNSVDKATDSVTAFTKQADILKSILETLESGRALSNLGSSSATGGLADAEKQVAGLNAQLRGFDRALIELQKGIDTRGSGLDDARTRLSQIIELAPRAGEALVQALAKAQFDSNQDLISRNGLDVFNRGRGAGLRDTPPSQSDIAGQIRNDASNRSIPNSRAIALIQQEVVGVTRLRDALQSLVDRRDRAAKAELAEAIARDEAREAIEKQIATIERAAKLASLSEDDQELFIAQEKTKAATSKLSAAEQVAALLSVGRAVKDLQSARVEAAQQEESRASTSEAVRDLEKFLETQRQALDLAGKDADEKERILTLKQAEQIADAAGVENKDAFLRQLEIELDTIQRLNEEREAAIEQKRRETALEASRVRDDEARREKEREAQKNASEALDSIFENLRIEQELVGKSADAREDYLAILEITKLALQTEGQSVDELTERYLRLIAAIREAQDRVKVEEQSNTSREEQIQQLADGTAEAVTDFFDALITNFDDLGEAAETLVKDVQRVALEALVLDPLEDALKVIFKSLFSSLLAKGGVVQGGHIVPHRTGFVDTGPSFFPLANGATGLRGEAGPEATLPLTRIPGSNKLGVESTSRGGSRINVNMTVVTRDADSFRRSRNQIQNDLKRAVLRGVGDGV